MGKASNNASPREGKMLSECGEEARVSAVSEMSKHRHCIDSQQEGLTANAGLPAGTLYSKGQGDCKPSIQDNAESEASFPLVCSNLEMVSSQEGVNLLFSLFLTEKVPHF